MENLLIPLMICLMKEEAVLDDDAREVATTISGHLAKKLIKRSSCELCKQTLASQEVDLENDSYLKLLSCSGLFVPSRHLADFVCGCFAILDFPQKGNNFAWNAGR